MDKEWLDKDNALWEKCFEEADLNKNGLLS